jgi:hypothetical protein
MTMTARPPHLLGATTAVLALTLAPAAYADPGGATPAHQSHQNHHANHGQQVGHQHASQHSTSHANAHGHHAGTGNRGAVAHPVHPTPPAHPTHPTTHPTPGAAGGPAGNNGTVKISLVGDRDGTPNEVAHPGCTFEVQWYGFDAGPDVVSTVSFTPMAPTGGVTIAVDGPSTVPVGADAATGAGTSTGLDAVQDYRLSFSGGAPAKQGYHVRVTVHTPRSQGNDTKTKVFWVEPCTPGSTATPAPTATAPAPEGGSIASTGPGTTSTATSGITSGIAEGAAISASPSPAAAAARRSPVPTSIDAGLARHGLDAWVHSPWPLAIAGLGALIALVGALRLRRRA